MRGVIVNVENSDPIVVACPAEGNIAHVLMQVSGILSTPKEARHGPLVLGTVSSLCTTPDGGASAGEIPSTVVDSARVTSAQMVEIIWMDGEVGWIPIALAAEYEKNKADD